MFLNISPYHSYKLGKFNAHQLHYEYDLSQFRLLSRKLITATPHKRMIHLATMNENEKLPENHNRDNIHPTTAAAHVPLSPITHRSLFFAPRIIPGNLLISTRLHWAVEFTWKTTGEQ